MPELPEVETVKRQLVRNVKGRIIKDVWTDTKKIVRNVSFERFKKETRNKKIIDIKRRGKYLLFELSNDYTMLVHFKMTGHLLLGNWKIENNRVIPLTRGVIKEDKMNKYIHLIFSLDNKKQLAFSDLRKFGVFELHKNFKGVKLGKDALEITFDEFKNLFKNRNIKMFLMDQGKIAGVGNIYANEALFLAGISPLRKDLNETELKRVFNAMQKVLKKGIEVGGDSFSDFRNLFGEEGRFNSFSNVYRRKICPKCGGKIKRTNIGQRGTYYCPKCQK